MWLVSLNFVKYWFTLNLTLIIYILFDIFTFTNIRLTNILK